jgi:ATP-dependent DNA helicase Rep
MGFVEHASKADPCERAPTPGAACNFSGSLRVRGQSVESALPDSSGSAFLMRELNPPQREAVRYVEGPLLVLAGAGSGKTRVIAHKIAHLIAAHQVEPDGIAAITFTNKAANEMQSRVADLLPKGARVKPWISTFHTLGLRILKEEFEACGLRPRFTLFDARDSEAALADIARRSFGSTTFDIGAIQHRVSAWKSALHEPATVPVEEKSDPLGKAAFACYAEYLRTLQAFNAVDFDDLIRLPSLLLRNSPGTLLKWQARLRWLLVDEYQDTNLAQYELVRMLVSAKQRLTAVGDDDQSIYAWRGARPENLAALTQDFPTLKVIKLEQNYRSMGVILKAANQLISTNPHVFEKRLWSEKGFGERIRVMGAADEFTEAELVVNLINHQRVLNNTPFRDFAILFRSNHQARVFESALRERGIPYIISGSRSFFDASEVKDMLCYLRAIANSGDDTALLRIINTPRRGLGAATVEVLVQVASELQRSLRETLGTSALESRVTTRVAKLLQEFGRWLDHFERESESLSPLELARQVISDVSYEDWLEQSSDTPEDATRRKNNVFELLDWIARLLKQNPERSLTDVVASLTLIDMLDRKDDDEDKDALSLMTLHAAKGLEFPQVYLVGFEENILPHRSSIDGDTIEEERRLAYVGITRAQQRLTISWARTRKRYGKTEECQPSRFVEELPKEDLVFDGEAGKTTDRTAARATLASLKGLLGS